MTVQTSAHYWLRDMSAPRRSAHIWLQVGPYCIYMDRHGITIDREIKA